MKQFASLALAAALALPVAALAQTPPPAQTPPRANAQAGGMEQRVQQHIEQLHAELQITPAQQQQWNQFAQVMQQNAADMHQALQQRGAQFSTMNAAQDMQSYAHLAAVHAEDMQRLAEAFQPLYQSMSPAQRQHADTVFRNREMNRAGAHRRGTQPG